MLFKPGLENLFMPKHADKLAIPFMVKKNRVKIFMLYGVYN